MNSRPSRPDDPAHEMLARYQASGDLGALDNLLREEIATLKERLRRRYGHLLTPTKSASDVAQDAAVGWVRVAHRTSFENPHALRGYLLRAAFRLLVRHSRQRSARPGSIRIDGEGGVEVREESDGPEALVATKEDRTTLRLALSMLPKDQRVLLEKVYLEQQDVKVAAEALGVDPEAAYKRVQRGRTALAERLAAWARVLE